MSVTDYYPGYFTDIQITQNHSYWTVRYTSEAQSDNNIDFDSFEEVTIFVEKLLAGEGLWQGL